MTTDGLGARMLTDVLLTPISDTEWRVSDARVEWDSPSSLIGFISLNAGRYEVLEFADPVRTHFVDSVAEAAATFVEPAGNVSTLHPVRELHRMLDRLDRARAGRRR